MARDEATQDARARRRGAPASTSARDPASWIGKRLGSYRVEGEIARGGMGVVLAAVAVEGPAAGSTVALKLVRGEHAAPIRRAFVREARVSSRLDHPNVVRTLDAGEAEGELYLAMELVVGVTWSRLLARLADLGERPDPLLAAWIVARVARGLHAAHELTGDDGAPLALVHRDVSPQNVLLDFDGRVLVADFGIAKFANDGTTTEDGVMKGKLGYMSPEQVRCEPLDRRSDVFAMGAVLYEGLTGERAFDGRNPGEVVARLLHGAPRDPRSVRPEVPSALARIAMRCLAAEPAQRYASALEVAQALDEALGGEAEDAPERLARELTTLFAEERERLESARGSGELSFAPTQLEAPPPSSSDEEPTLVTSSAGEDRTLRSRQLDVVPQARTPEVVIAEPRASSPPAEVTGAPPAPSPLTPAPAAAPAIVRVRASEEDEPSATAPRGLMAAGLAVALLAAGLGIALLLREPPPPPPVASAAPSTSAAPPALADDSPPPAAAPPDPAPEPATSASAAPAPSSVPAADAPRSAPPRRPSAPPRAAPSSGVFRDW